MVNLTHNIDIKRIAETISVFTKDKYQARAAISNSELPNRLSQIQIEETLEELDNQHNSNNQINNQSNTTDNRNQSYYPLQKENPKDMGEVLDPQDYNSPTRTEVPPDYLPQVSNGEVYGQYDPHTHRMLISNALPPGLKRFVDWHEYGHSQGLRDEPLTDRYAEEKTGIRSFRFN
jgi:hypothetical protein